MWSFPCENVWNVRRGSACASAITAAGRGGGGGGASSAAGGRGGGRGGASGPLAEPAAEGSSISNVAAPLARGLLVILADGGVRGRARRAGPRFHTPDPRRTSAWRLCTHE
jgi:hypothetical protein